MQGAILCTLNFEKQVIGERSKDGDKENKGDS